MAESGEMEKEGREEGGKEGDGERGDEKGRGARAGWAPERGAQSSGRATRRTDPARETRQAAEAGAHVANYRGGSFDR